ncbi:MAG: hypothetical protein MUE96_09820 [Bacteroidia bacterium]|jgi:hypothetical protein|nr:hypothetical protein [Bacteroidia bacterium]
MKQHIVYPILFLLFIVSARFNSLEAQDLTIAELIKFRTMSVDDLNDILVSKGWQFYGNEYEVNKWTFSRSLNGANAWLAKGKNWDKRLFIRYVFCNITGITKLKNELLAAGYVKINSESFEQTITTNYSNKVYEISITYSAEIKGDECDSYTIEILKAKTQAELKREQVIIDSILIAEQKIMDQCKKNKEKRANRNKQFKSLIDSLNAEYYSGLIDNKRLRRQRLYGDFDNLPEAQRNTIIQKEYKDSIAAAERKADSLAAMEAAMFPYNEIKEYEGIPFSQCRGITIVYSEPYKSSEVISILNPNDLIKIKDEFSDFYAIYFDYCPYEYTSSIGFIKKVDVILKY